MRPAMLMLLAALLLPWPATAQPNLLAQEFERALALDAPLRALAAQREAVAARRATVNSPIAGSPALAGGFRGDTRGLGRARESDLEFAVPLWLPGQRGALGETVTSDIAATEQRMALRRLEVAGRLRDAWWVVALARRDAALARDRLATARDIARDVSRRAELGDIPPAEALLARNETLAAELALAEAAAAVAQAESAYALLTGAPPPNLPLEPLARPHPAHPLLGAAEAAQAAAEARARLVAATPRENPELAVYGRQQDGLVTEQGSSVGFRVRLPLATEARNAPRRAEAEAEITRAAAELALARRSLEREIAAAGAALTAAEGAVRLARQRLGVARTQLDLARRAFRAGETGLFDLYRVRQLQLEAEGAEARATVALGRARARLNQALGAEPGA